jgi:hypothetical protein
VWLHDELRYAALQFQVDAPSALAIGAVFFLYGAIIAAYAAFGLSSYAT